MKQVQLIIKIALAAAAAGALVSVFLHGALWLTALLAGAAGVFLAVYSVVIPVWKNREQLKNDEDYRRRAALLGALYLAAAVLLVSSLFVRDGHLGTLPVLALLLAAAASAHSPL